MRLEGHKRMGYYPTPPDVVSRIRKCLELPKRSFSAIDSCCGMGEALEKLTKRSQAVTYGVELDEHRSGEAKERLDHVIRGDFFRMRITKRLASLLFLNPPYADGDDGRLELQFLKAAHPILKPGGLLVFIIPQNRLSPRIAKTLASHFEQIRVYKFPRGEYERFRQIVVFGVRRAKPSGDGIPALHLFEP